MFERLSVSVAKEDEKEAYRGLAMGAKMEGIMESLAQKAQSSPQEKKMCQKKNLEGKFLAL